MTDKEKVIEALELCTSKIETRTQIPCETCSYHNRNYHGVFGDGCCNALSLKRDILALLKAQEPRVMTLEELKSCDRETIWFQVKSNHTMKQLTQDGIAALTFIGLLYNWNGYGTIWRCWTSRPTDEQREAAPWNAQNVDAIPVEWIMKWSNKQYRETQRDVSIVDVLAAWQKEQEAR